MNECYGIKPEYSSRRVAQTRVDAGADYWTDTRVASAAAYQYDVYCLARDLLARDTAKSFLDVGSGPAVKVADLIAPVCDDITLLDQAATGAITARYLPHATFVAADLEEIDVSLGRRFDVIVCADVVEHLLDPDPCLAFVRDHLAAGGHAVLSTPDRERLRGADCRESPHPDHVREWSADEFTGYLASRGLRVERQLWLPDRRRHPLEALVRRLAAPLGFVTPDTCQVAVCRVAGPEPA